MAYARRRTTRSRARTRSGSTRGRSYTRRATRAPARRRTRSVSRRSGGTSRLVIQVVGSPQGSPVAATSSVSPLRAMF